MFVQTVQHPIRCSSAGSTLEHVRCTLMHIDRPTATPRKSALKSFKFFLNLHSLLGFFSRFLFAVPHTVSLTVLLSPSSKLSRFSLKIASRHRHASRSVDKMPCRWISIITRLAISLKPSLFQQKSVFL